MSRRLLTQGSSLCRNHERHDAYLMSKAVQDNTRNIQDFQKSLNIFHITNFLIFTAMQPLNKNVS